MKVERLLHAFSMIGEDPARIQQLRQVAVALAVAGELGSGNATLTGKAWYVFASPAELACFEIAHLASAPGPQISIREGWEVLGREFRVVLDFGVAATDWRGAYRNAGE
jgi:hypothetical protein